MSDLFINSRNRSLNSYMQRETERYQRNKKILIVVYTVLLFGLLILLAL